MRGCIPRAIQAFPCRSDAEHAKPRRPGRTRKHVACAVSCLPIRRYESSIRITLTYEKLVKRPRAGSAGRGAGNKNLSLLGRGGRLDSAHLYWCVRVSFLPSPSSPALQLHLVSLRAPLPSPVAVTFDPAVRTCRYVLSRLWCVRILITPSSSARSPSFARSFAPDSRPDNVADLDSAHQTPTTSPRLAQRREQGFGEGRAQSKPRGVADVFEHVRRRFCRVSTHF